MLGNSDHRATAGEQIRIGRHVLANRVLLAPMSGVTDLPFRRLAHRLGAGLVVSEMVASEDLVRERAHILRRVEGRELRPFVIQLVGREVHWMAEGARIAQERGADVVDINMGCPAREVTGKLSGSALMRDLDHALSLIAAVVQAVKIPVTLKMRLGWDQRSRNAAELGATRRSCRRAAHHRAWAHALPVLQGQRRLGRGARGEETPSPSRSSSTATSIQPRRGASRAAGLGRRRRHDRTRRLRRSVAAGTDRSVSCVGPRSRPRRSLAEQGAIAREHIEAMLSHYGAELGLAQRAQARRLVSGEQRTRGCDREGLASAPVHRGRSRGACCEALPHSTRKSWRPRHDQDRNASPATPARRPVEHDLLLAALPHPILVLADDNRIIYANAAAEAFLTTGIALLKRVRLDDVIAFGCPLLALVEQVRRQGATVNEYGVEITAPKFQSPKLVDVYAGPVRRPGRHRRASCFSSATWR